MKKHPHHQLHKALDGMTKLHGEAMKHLEALKKHEDKEMKMVKKGKTEKKEEKKEEKKKPGRPKKK